MRGTWHICAALALLACTPPANEPAAFAAVGVYANGSGLQGLALRLEARDGSGHSLHGSWRAELRDAAGLVRSDLEVQLSSASPVAAFWWPDVEPSPGRYSVTLSGSEVPTLTADADLSPEGALPPPEARLSEDGARLVWTAVDGAAQFRCTVSGRDGAQQLEAFSTAPECDVSALPPGAYRAEVVAFSESATVPSEAARGFHVAASALSFSPAPEGGAQQGAVVGGALSYGTTVPGLALAMALSDPGGVTTTEPWDLEVSGPGISAAAPILFQFPAGAPRMVAWSYEYSARAGRYSWVATGTSSGRILAGDFWVGEPEVLGAVSDVTVRALPSGSAEVTFSPVTDAVAYYVSVWTQQGTFAAARWITAPPADFPQGTFAAGTAYDVYVAASNVDVTVVGALPPQARVSENTFFPTSFVGQ